MIFWFWKCTFLFELDASKTSTTVDIVIGGDGEVDIASGGDCEVDIASGGDCEVDIASGVDCVTRSFDLSVVIGEQLASLYVG